MIDQVVYPRADDRSVTLTHYVYTPKSGETAKKRPAMVIFPGGGFTHMSWREAEPVARKFFAAGFQTFILRYSLLEKTKYPHGALYDASWSVAYVRDHAEEWNIDPDAVFICGFSAGGHLAGSLGTRWHDPALRTREDMPYGHNRPTGMILTYSVLDGVKYPNESTICLSLGIENPTQEERISATVMTYVDEKTPPAFLWHCSDDICVPVPNSYMMAEAMHKAGRPFELHVYPYGAHGLSLANEEISMNNPAMIVEDVQEWIDLAIDWCLRTKETEKEALK